MPTTRLLLLPLVAACALSIGAAGDVTIPPHQVAPLPTPPAGTASLAVEWPATSPGPFFVRGTPALACDADRTMLCVPAPACTANQMPPPQISDSWIVLDKLASGKWGTKANPIDAARLARIKQMAGTFTWFVSGGCYVASATHPLACSATAADVPTGGAIATRLQEVKAAASGVLRGGITALLGYGDAFLRDAMARALAAARCRSDRAPGPTDPYAVPADQVKAWLLGVVGGPDAPLELQALRPLVDGVPPADVRWAWLRVVELRRGLPVRLDR